ncbi:MAG: hypothetical protein K2P70_00750 [Hyphomonadaceae bacterium]|nr:hypothetical protein [Hyphomonadaceae bacterium]
MRLFEEGAAENVTLDVLRSSMRLGFLTAFADQFDDLSKGLKRAEEEVLLARQDDPDFEGVTDSTFNYFRAVVLGHFDNVISVVEADRLKGSARDEHLARFADSVEVYERTSEDVYFFTDQIIGRPLLEFAADRLKVQLRDHGKRHDLVDAVFALGDDDLVRIVARVEALDAFLKTEDGANLLAGYKRAANILAAEEKKGKWSAEEATGEVDASKLSEPAEKALFDALAIALPAARAAVEKEEFAQAMKALSSLRAPVDAFFEKVMVNAEDAVLRRNRLLLLSRLREALSAVADFSKIEG